MQDSANILGMMFEVKIASRTVVGKSYTVFVDTEADSCTCECEGYKNRLSCSHQAAALVQLIADVQAPINSDLYWKGNYCGFCGLEITEKKFADTAKGPAHAKCLWPKRIK